MDLVELIDEQHNGISDGSVTFGDAVVNAERLGYLAELRIKLMKGDSA